ncbi:MAG: 23S rRNA (adenine(2030)-N(6))-methyltransferase RlmJ [Rhodobacteraceae bacterium]|nr:MAG: 23S rRNA (adenine(2030)-N(6))-methyltransferase RlmJ [Paracoccaceae bacterium]
MLSYQHAYHAGGPADVHKHAALAALLHLLTRKDRPITYLESHAGRALYDLASPETAKTGEAMRGVARLTPGAHPYWTAVEKIRAAHGPAAYPGSPAVAQALLRPGDRMALMELHPAEHAGLAAAMKGEGVAVHKRDGAEGLRALTPPDPRRGLALIDPSYEVKTEYVDTAMLALEISVRWPEGVVMVWYPLLPAGRHEALVGPVEAVEPKGLIRDEVIFADPPPRGMFGSGLLLLNAPYGAAEALAEARAVCAAAYADDAAAA